MQIIFSKINLYIIKNNGNRFIGITSVDESKDTLRNQTKFNSDDDLPMEKALGMYFVIIVIEFVFNDGNKPYSQSLLDKGLNKLAQEI